MCRRGHRGRRRHGSRGRPDRQVHPHPGGIRPGRALPRSWRPSGSTAASDSPRRARRSGPAGSTASTTSRWRPRRRSNSSGPNQVEWFEQVRYDYPDLRAAMDYCLAEPDQGQAGLQMAADLLFHWVRSYYLNEGRGWLDRMLAQRPGTDSRPGQGVVGGQLAGHHPGRHHRREGDAARGAPARRAARIRGGARLRRAVLRLRRDVHRRRRPRAGVVRGGAGQASGRRQSARSGADPDPSLAGLLLPRRLRAGHRPRRGLPRGQRRRRGHLVQGVRADGPRDRGVAAGRRRSGDRDRAGEPAAQP